MDLEDAKKMLINGIKSDVDRFTKGDLKTFGELFDTCDLKLPRDLDDGDIYLALNFWDSWIDECGHGFEGFYKPIERTDWVPLALEIISSLENNKKITNSLLVEKFDITK